MAPPPAYIKDVASRAGVHPSTVSRVLNPGTRSMVSDHLARRIMEVAEELGYRRNPLAAGLRTQRTYTVGIVLPDITNPVFPPIVRGAEHTLGGEGYTAILADSGGRRRSERTIIDNLKSRRVDGLKCPDDISVTGFNDMPFVDRFDPPLTTLHIPLDDLGIQAAKLLLERIRQPDAPVKQLRLEPRIVVRGSTAPPA